ncbi:MAG: hypothetical protein JNM70_15645 [Anaerolineae bacterium]|nr:hypothetical protein [Anaerolineae bacterium]
MERLQIYPGDYPDIEKYLDMELSKLIKGIKNDLIPLSSFSVVWDMMMWLYRTVILRENATQLHPKFGIDDFRLSLHLVDLQSKMQRRDELCNQLYSDLKKADTPSQQVIVLASYINELSSELSRRVSPLKLAALIIRLGVEDFFECVGHD